MGPHLPICRVAPCGVAGVRQAVVKETTSAVLRKWGRVVIPVPPNPGLTGFWIQSLVSQTARTTLSGEAPSPSLEVGSSHPPSFPKPSPTQHTATQQTPPALIAQEHPLAQAGLPNEFGEPHLPASSPPPHPGRPAQQALWPHGTLVRALSSRKSRLLS